MANVRNKTTVKFISEKEEPHKLKWQSEKD